MKKIIPITLLLLSSCSNTETTISKKSKKSSIMPENNMCICVKIYKPVCGRDKKTYPNACEANCKKVRFTEGECLD